MNTEPTLREAFVEIGKRFFADNSEVDHRWSVDLEKGVCVLEVPMSHEGGFDIQINVDADSIMIQCGDFHDHHDLDRDAVEFSNLFFGYIYNLLTPMMRLRVFCSNCSPYKWSLECCVGDSWELDSTTGSLLFNYFGKKTELLLQNNTLPERKNPLV